MIYTPKNIYSLYVNQKSRQPKGEVKKQNKPLKACSIFLQHTQTLFWKATRYHMQPAIIFAKKS